MLTTIGGNDNSNSGTGGNKNLSSGSEVDGHEIKGRKLNNYNAIQFCFWKIIHLMLFLMLYLF